MSSDTPRSESWPVLGRGAGARLAGERGHVKRLQSELRRVGYQRLSVDGIFGPITRAAVVGFQERAGLTADGICGRDTWRALAGAADTSREWFVTTYGEELEPHVEAAGAYRTHIEEGARRAGVPAAVLAGLGSRESGWGLLLEPPGPAGRGDHGHGRGLLQIDDRYHKGFIASGDWKDPRKNILYGAAFLHERLNRLKHAGRVRLRAALAAYNASLARVKLCIEEGRNVDSVTTGRNYSRDVLDRAGYFQLQGW